MVKQELQVQDARLVNLLASPSLNKNQSPRSKYESKQVSAATY